tara:strand:+ start:580 stop:774 length:195 start_codon:yes stop_codon:yes gene_type:complete
VGLLSLQDPWAAGFKYLTLDGDCKDGKISALVFDAAASIGVSQVGFKYRRYIDYAIPCIHPSIM